MFPANASTPASAPAYAQTEPFSLHSDFADQLPELTLPVQPSAASARGPRLVALNEDVAALLGVDARLLQTREGVEALAGERFIAGSHPVAQIYAGHQWGVFNPRLGDGRAMLLGNIRSAAGGANATRRSYDLHLKGTGPTPLSRGDGYAVIGSMLRGYLLGEAMHALGVPTTRALAVVDTGLPQVRDGVAQPGAVLARVARSHLRFGSFQYIPGTGDLNLLRRLADFAISQVHPEASNAPLPYQALFTAVVDAHARLTADWMRLGFVHGVLSTDNVTISGETIDYGPCAFVDRYDPGIWFSSIDRNGRYAYEQQPKIMAWNLARLGEALAPLLGESPEEARDFVEEALQRYAERYEQHRSETFRAKLGLLTVPGSAAASTLIDEVLALLQRHRIDFTGFFADLADAAAGDASAVRARFSSEADTATADRSVPGSSAVPSTSAVPSALAELEPWLQRWSAQNPSAARMRSVNPVYIPRNHLIDEALESAALGDLRPFDTLLDVVSHPFERRADVAERYTQPGAEGDCHVTYCGT